MELDCSDLSDKLSRYETSLQKQLSAPLPELQTIQERRLRQSEAWVPAPENAETA